MRRLSCRYSWHAAAKRWSHHRACPTAARRQFRRRLKSALQAKHNDETNDALHQILRDDEANDVLLQILLDGKANDALLQAKHNDETNNAGYQQF